MRVFKSVLPALLLLCTLSACSRPEKLVVYTASEADQLPAYTAAFKAAHPEIEILWVRDSTGVITAKLLAERKAEQADVVFALSAASMMQLDEKGLLAAYAPKDAERLKPRFRDPRTPPHWTGQALWSAVICVNTVEARKHNLPVPARWEDLTAPVYRAMIEMPNPASSGTGLLAVNAWLQIFGEARGWAYMDGLHQNIASYTHSGSKPCKDVARGEIPIGVSIDFRAAEAKTQGLPVDVVVPAEGVGWDMEATALMAGARHEAAAKTFIDWAVSRDAQRLFARNFAIVADPAVTEHPANLPSDLEARLARIDLAESSRNRDRIIDAWSRRYGAKAEAKP